MLSYFVYTKYCIRIHVVYVKVSHSLSLIYSICRSHFFSFTETDNDYSIILDTQLLHSELYSGRLCMHVRRNVIVLTHKIISDKVVHNCS